MKKINTSNSKNTLVDNTIKDSNVHVGDKIINVYHSQEKATETGSNTGQIAKRVKDLVAKSKIKQALEILLTNKAVMDEDLNNAVIQQSQRWNNLKKDEMLGVISSEKADILRNRIVYAILGIANELE